MVIIIKVLEDYNCMLIANINTRKSHKDHRSVTFYNIIHIIINRKSRKVENRTTIREVL